MAEMQHHGIFEMLRHCFMPQHTDTMFSNRTIRLDGTVYPVNSVTNSINNRKYSIVGFIPMVLFNQFKYFFNMFFLLLALSQFIDELKVGNRRLTRTHVFVRCAVSVRSGAHDAQGGS